MKIYCLLVYAQNATVGDDPRIERFFRDKKDAEACQLEINKAAGWPRATDILEEELE